MPDVTFQPVFDDDRLCWIKLTTRTPERHHALRLETLDDGRFRIRAGGAVYVWARLRHLQYVALLYDEAQPALIPPISSRLARRLSAGPAPLLRAARWLVEHLMAGPGALPAGDWGIRPLGFRLPVYPLQARFWCQGSGPLGDFIDHLLPTRGPKRGDKSRLKALRKRANEGTITPGLVWRVTGLQGWFVLDGHLRLQAGAPALELFRRGEPDDVPNHEMLDMMANSLEQIRMLGALTPSVARSSVKMWIPQPVVEPSHAVWEADASRWDGEVVARAAALCGPIPEAWEMLDEE